MNLLIFFQLALRNLRLNKFRSILAIFGITIGIVAIARSGISGAILENSQFQSMNEIDESIDLQVNYTYLWNQYEESNTYYGVSATTSIAYGGGYVQPKMEGITNKQIQELGKITSPYPVILYKTTISSFEVVESEYLNMKGTRIDITNSSAATLNPNATMMQMLGIPVEEAQVSLADVLNYTFSANVLMYIPRGTLYRGWQLVCCRRCILRGVRRIWIRFRY